MCVFVKNNRSRWLCTTKTAILPCDHQLLSLLGGRRGQLLRQSLLHRGAHHWVAPLLRVASRREALVEFASTLRSRSARWIRTCSPAGRARRRRNTGRRSWTAHAVYLPKDTTYTPARNDKGHLNANAIFHKATLHFFSRHDRICRDFGQVQARIYLYCKQLPFIYSKH